MAPLSRWVWGMYIFREPVHIALLLAIPPKLRCGMDSLMDCVGIDDATGTAGLTYTRFYDMQPWVWVVYVLALTVAPSCVFAVSCCCQGERCQCVSGAFLAGFWWLQREPNTQTPPCMP